jgi:hypothetical protein
MKKCFLSLALLINVFVSYRSVEALPGMTSQEMQSYFNKNTIVSKLIAAQKYEESYPDFTAKGKISNGELSLSIFMDDNQKVSQESIDYWPKCYPKDDCQGMIAFEKNTNDNGHKLIQQVWDKTILLDFQSSKLMYEDKTIGAYRWYQGKLFNYETGHYEKNTIAHFSVVSKNDLQSKRIKEYQRCLRENC